MGSPLERRVRDEMVKSLGEWGVRRSESKEHTLFYDRAVATAITLSRPTEKKNVALLEVMKEFRTKPSSMPRDPVDAIIHVLASELEGVGNDDQFYDTEDTLDEYFQPFYSWTNKANKVVFKRRLPFEKFKLEQLDPLKRFTVTTYKAPDYFFSQWSNKSSLAGTVFEALVACHVVYSAACYNCKFRNVLRWNGGRDSVSSWVDLVCIECQSTFEVKSQGSADTIERRLRYHDLRGGSFATFYRYAPLGKRFVVVVNRQESYNKDTKSMTHRVSVAEIKTILPRLCDYSFAGRQNKNLSLKSSIDTNASAMKVWCHVDACQADFSELAIQVFDSHFGQGAWMQAESLDTLLKLNSKDVTASKDKSTSEPKGIDLDSLKQSLQDMKTLDGDGSDEDWETMYDSNDDA
jgi:hypothetical protein